MCWVAINRGIDLAERCMRQAPVRRWAKVRDEIHDTVMTRGWNDDRKAFVQTLDGDDLDAALLLLPSFDFIAYDDERMVSTTDAVWRDLDDGDGLLRRYRTDDGLDGREGAFIACSFWLVECLAHQGRVADAQQVFDHVVATGNGLGLFSEQFDPDTREMLGNFPQGISHFSHVAAALALRGSGVGER
jgi:GH15 family glucan-1,4-alpha-glucosidase